MNHLDAEHTKADSLASSGWDQAWAKMRLASSRVSREPMSYQRPGPCQVKNGWRRHIHCTRRPGWSVIAPRLGASAMSIALIMRNKSSRRRNTCMTPLNGGRDANSAKPDFTYDKPFFVAAMRCSEGNANSEPLLTHCIKMELWHELNVQAATSIQTKPPSPTIEPVWQLLPCILVGQ